MDRRRPPQIDLQPEREVRPEFQEVERELGEHRRAASWSPLSTILRSTIDGAALEVVRGLLTSVTEGDAVGADGPFGGRRIHRMKPARASRPSSRSATDLNI